MATLLSIIVDACDRIGIARPQVVITAVDPQIKTLLNLANQEGRALARRGAWQNLQREAVFTAIAAEEQIGSVPADLERFIPDTFYNRTQTRGVLGPLSPQQWSVEKSVLATVVWDSYRVRGNDILLMPTPTAGNVYAFEYISKNWCQSEDETTQSDRFVTDSDSPLLESEFFIQGVVWRFKKSKGLDYSEDFREYEIQVTQALMRDGDRPTVNFAEPGRPYGPRVGIPDGNWNLV